MPFDFLSDVTVADFSQAGAGPYAGSLLADFGADVISIEPPDGGTQRKFVRKSVFPHVGRNKRSIAVDLKHDDADRVIRRIAEESDVLIESYTPGTPERLGIDYDTIRGYNEKIIYCSITGYGESGPYKNWPAFDPLAQAMSGLMSNTGEPDRKPSRIGSSIMDFGTGVFAALGVLVSLWNRQGSNEGRKFEVSLYEVGAAFMGNWYTYVDLYDRTPQRLGHAWEPYAPIGLFTTQDEPVYIAIALEKQWNWFCEAINKEEWKNDPRFKTNEERIENREELYELMEEELTKYSQEDAIELLLEHRVPVAPLQTIREAASDQHLQNRDTIIEIDDFLGQDVRAAGTPYVFYGDKYGQATLPELGEHSGEITSEFGLSKSQIQEMYENSVIFSESKKDN